MKKILFSILLVLLLKENVIAKTYYSNYSGFTDYSLEEIESSELVNVEVKKVYNRYFDVAEGDYYALEENPIIYPYINVNIYKDTEFTEWNKTYPIDKLGRVIETRNICDNEPCTISHLEYRYKDRLYFHYCEKPKLLSENSVLNGYIKNENDYIAYYRYQTRDKIEVADKIVILDKLDSIDNFITSTVPYKIIGNINYNKNDTYHISITTDFVDIPVTVEVLIIDDIKNYYNKIIFNKDLSINNLTDRIKDYQQGINIKSQEISTLTDKISSLESNLIINNNLKETLTIENNILNIKVNNLQMDNNNFKNKILEYKNINDTLELSIVDLKKEIINLNELLLNKENVIKSNNNSINKLNNMVKDYEIEINQKDDALKKLNLCNKVNNTLEEEINDNKNINKQNIFYILFVGIIFFLISCAILKIKSMKKNN